MRNFCPRRGTLVGAKLLLPPNLFDFQFPAYRTVVGCNSIWCDSCKVLVKQRPGWRAKSTIEKTLRQIYVTDDWQSWIASGEIVARNNTRFYHCNCDFRVESDRSALLGDPEIGIPDPPWHCNGHLAAPLPLTEDGLVLSEKTDWIAIVSAYFDDQLTTPKIAQWGIDWVNRLYSIFPAKAQDSLSAAVWYLIRSTNPKIAVRAATFFGMFPEKLPVDELIALFATNRAMLEQTINPLPSGQSLRYWLLQPIASRLRLKVEAAALAFAQAEALSAELVPPTLIGALEEVAPDWFALHRATFAARYPSLLLSS